MPIKVDVERLMSGGMAFLLSGQGANAAACGVVPARGRRQNASWPEHECPGHNAAIDNRCIVTQVPRPASRWVVRKSDNFCALVRVSFTAFLAIAFFTTGGAFSASSASFARRNARSLSMFF